jgi:phosphomannomutase
MRQPNPSIFREYDIRGVYGKTLFDEDAYFIGQSYAAMLPQNAKICVGYDGRHSSPALAEQLIKGLTESGVNVINIGLVPSPAAYFSVFHLDSDGAIMITASHNPPADNGFKFMLGKDAMFGEQIKKLQFCDLVSSSKVLASCKNIDIRQDYINRVLLDLKTLSPSLRIAWDTANGAMGEVADMLTTQLMEDEQGEHFLLNPDIDGSFPAHPADPTKLENNEELIATVLDNNCDIGFGFDGDGDRLGIIDEKGRMLYGDQILSILARDVLATHPNAPIIADIKSSRLFAQEITRLGGQPILWKTGHSLIKSKMKELKAPLAGEMSGHIFFADKYYGYDDAIYAAIRFLNIMTATGLKASELLDALPQMHSSPEYRIKVSEEKKFAIIEDIKKSLITNHQPPTTILDIDGVRVNEENGWWLVRASNTGAEIIVRFEGDTEEGLKTIQALVTKILEKYGINLNN